MRRKYSFVASSGVLAATFALMAADVEAAPNLLPESRSSKAGADLNLWSAQGVGTTLGLIPFLQYGFTEHVFLRVQTPIALSIDGPGSQAYAGLGNPTVGVHYATTADALTWYIGGRLGIPLATVDVTGWQTAMVLGDASTAAFDRHYWRPDYMPFGIYGGVEFFVSPAFVLRGELAPQLYVPIKQPEFPGLTNKTRFFYTARAEAEARADVGLGGGVALQVAHSPSEDGDNAQAAVEGFGSFDNGKWFARLGLLVAVDKPYGFGFDKGQVATLHGRIGKRF